MTTYPPYALDYIGETDRAAAEAMRAWVAAGRPVQLRFDFDKEVTPDKNN